MSPLPLAQIVCARYAEKGRDGTKDMIAKVGRSSRLGERSRGVIDAGSASCCLILQTMAQAIKDKVYPPPNKKLPRRNKATG